MEPGKTNRPPSVGGLVIYPTPDPRHRPRPSPSSLGSWAVFILWVVCLKWIGLTLGRGRSLMHGVAPQLCRSSSPPIVRRRSRGSLPRLHLTRLKKGLAQHEQREMTASKNYQWCAARCLQEARTANDARQKAFLIEMAQAWQRLAGQATNSEDNQVSIVSEPDRGD